MDCTLVFFKNTAFEISLFILFFILSMSVWVCASVCRIFLSIQLCLGSKLQLQMSHNRRASVLSQTNQRQTVCKVMKSYRAHIFSHLFLDTSLSLSLHPSVLKLPISLLKWALSRVGGPCGTLLDASDRFKSWRIRKWREYGWIDT